MSKASMDNIRLAQTWFRHVKVKQLKVSRSKVTGTRSISKAEIRKSSLFTKCTFSKFRVQSLLPRQITKHNKNFDLKLCPKLNSQRYGYRSVYFRYRNEAILINHQFKVQKNPGNLNNSHPKISDSLRVPKFILRLKSKTF